MRRALVLLLAVAMFLAACRAGPSASGSSATTPNTGPTALTPAPRVGEEIPHLSADELWQRLQAGESILVVDARVASDYEAQHIAGAISLPEAEATQRIGELPRDRLLVFY